MKRLSEKKNSNQGSKGKRRLPRFRRAEGEGLPKLRLTTRDAAILLAVYQYRVLTTPQVEKLFFATKGDDAQAKDEKGNRNIKINTRCQYRLQLLYHHGYLCRGEQAQKLTEGRKPFIYWLDRKGAQIIEQMQGGEELDWNVNANTVSSLFLEHLLRTNDVRIAISIATRSHKFTIANWLDDSTLKRRQMNDIVTLVGPNGGRQKAAVVPDGYFVLDTGSHIYHHFVEIDLRTVTGVASTWGKRDWARKVATYLEYYRSGKYQERYGTSSLRVLTITTGEKRLANLKAATEKAGGRSRFWFTTFERINTSDIFIDPIWAVASSENLRALTW